MINQETFLERAKKAHGEKYDYSEAVYQRALEKVIIICRDHGPFWQTPSSHWNGSGCSRCSGKAKLTFEDFIARSRAVHGERYDYSRVEYKGNLKKVTIVCRDHGPFDQEPVGHWRGHGCRLCAGVLMDQQLFLAKCREVHGELYGYDKTLYTNSQEKVEITCHRHGSFFQTPNNHLGGQGCPACHLEGRFLTQEEFLEKARKVHGDTYDYAESRYVDSTTKVKIGCRKHGPFMQLPLGHLYIKTGCPACKESRGEKRIRCWLATREMPFESQARLPGCQDKQSLKFDFLVDGVAIEYQGKHHYEPLVYGSKSVDPKLAFEGVQRRDQIKRDYCKSQGIELIEIPYWDFDNIESILEQHIS